MLIWTDFFFFFGVGFKLCLLINATETCKQPLHCGCSINAHDVIDLIPSLKTAVVSLHQPHCMHCRLMTEVYPQEGAVLAWSQTWDQVYGRDHSPSTNKMSAILFSLWRQNVDSLRFYFRPFRDEKTLYVFLWIIGKLVCVLLLVKGREKMQFGWNKNVQNVPWIMPSALEIGIEWSTITSSYFLMVWFLMLF